MGSEAHDSEEYREGILYHAKFNEIFTAVATHLREQEYFQKWEQETKEIMGKYPFLGDILQHGEGNVSLTEEEHKALVRYLELQDKMENAERQECYYIGHVHAGIHRHDVEKRMAGVSLFNVAGIMKEAWNSDLFLDLGWDHEKQPEFLGDFIQRLEYGRDERLKKNPGYLKLEKEERRILEKNPFLQSLLDAEAPSQKCEFTAAQQQAMVDLIGVYRSKAPYEELEMLQMGMKLCLEFLDILFR